MNATWSILEGDCRNAMAAMPEASVDAIVTDPPYLLGFMGRAWDTVERHAAQEWHHSWATEALRVLKPGGHLLAFGGTRTSHRLAVAIEDAGFEIRDTIAWLYGSGFPKSPTALKPAYEPIVVARKLARGAGALNVDGCRSAAGRWPANVALDEAAAAMLDTQSGKRGSFLPPGRDFDGGVEGNTVYGRKTPNRTWSYGDTGGASRFFYVPKADSAERNAGLSVASLFSPDAPERNDHPTVKPIDLMRWLVRLVTPSGGTVLDPFAGSGTTGCAAMREGVGFVGIEREAQYAAIARARLTHWSSGAQELAA